MKFSVDDFLRIGGNHKICEDYILTGDVEDILYIILSDGCSSSKNTEMGARILSHLAKSYIIDEYYYKKRDKFPKLDYMGNHIIHNSQLITKQLKLSDSCLDATLVIALFDKIKKLFQIYTYGDAVFVMEEQNQDITIIDIEYTNNAPYYLSYQIDEKRDELYYKMKIIKNIRTRKTTIVDPFEVCSDEVENFAYDYNVPMTLKITDFKTILICSDGMNSFIQKTDNGLTQANQFLIANEFLSLKNKNGEFLKRRCKRALKNLEQIYGITHYDDLSIGALTYEE
jgi:hypothetical protein